MKPHIKKGDTVQVIAGDDRGKQGRVLSVDAEKNRAIIEGVNIIIKHTKPTAKYPQGGRIEKEAPINLSNIALVDPKTNKPTRVAIKIEDGKKIRIAKKSGQEIK